MIRLLTPTEIFLEHHVVMNRRLDQFSSLAQSQNSPPAESVLSRLMGSLRKLTPRGWRAANRPSKPETGSTAEVRYRILFENSPDAVFVVAGSRETLREFNDRLPELLGYSREELSRMCRADFELGIPTLSMRSSIVSVFSPKTSEFDAQYLRADGTVINVAVTYSVVDYFGEVSYLMIARDVTARRRAEQLLRESEAKFRTLAETIPALVAIQREGQAVYVNPAFVKLSGYRASELLSMDLLGLIRSEFQADARQSVEACLRDQRPSWRREVVLLTKSGEERWIDLTVAPIALEGQSAWLASAVDVTERRKSEAELRQLNSQLFHAGRLRMLGELAAGIAHRVKHPIGNVGNLAQALINDLDRGQSTFHEELRETLVMIIEETNDADHTISEMIGFARRHEMNRRWIDLAPLLMDASRIARFDRRWADASIQVAADELRPNAFADREEITQVLIDLIRNGLEAMEAVPAADRKLKIELRNQRAGWLRVSVTDCGCGVPEERLSKLFKAFETTKPEGLGLGLSLCKTIIEGHGGQLWHEPAVPRGSTFHILLPSEERVFESHQPPFPPLEA
jgi:two-component system sensor kinase FixL